MIEVKTKSLSYRGVTGVTGVIGVTGVAKIEEDYPMSVSTVLKQVAAGVSNV